MSHGTAPERHARPGNPLASQSRAVLSFHARRRYYPDGDADEVRLVENERVPGNLLESRFPGFDEGDQPVMVTERPAREVIVNAWVDDDKEMDGRDPPVHVFSCSVQVGSVNGDGTWKTMLKEARLRRCEPPFNACIDELDENDMLNANELKRIPACIGRRQDIFALVLNNNNMIKVIENLETMTGLEGLFLDDNEISKIEGLDKLASLKHLSLSGNNITKIENLDKNVNLEQLWLSGTKVSKIENLDKNVNLKELGLSNTKVPKKEKQSFKAFRPGFDVW